MFFQENLIRLRKKAGYSARSFAKELDIPYTTYLAYEKTDREPKYKLLIEIANILNVSVDDLLGCKHDTDIKLKKSINEILSLSSLWIDGKEYEIKDKPEKYQKYVKLLNFKNDTFYFELHVFGKIFNLECNKSLFMKQYKTIKSRLMFTIKGDIENFLIALYIKQLENKFKNTIIQKEKDELLKTITYLQENTSSIYPVNFDNK